MTLIDLLQSNPIAFTVIVTILGLLIGSFLNVVIHRLPIMMERQWRVEHAEMVGVETEAAAQEKYNLIVPRSRCPQCGHAIGVLENIPVLSYLALRGKCSQCGTRIPVRYPVVEILTAAISCAVAWRFGFGWQAGAALLLSWALIALAFIDLDHYLLPDSITLPVLWAGLLASLYGVFVDSHASIIGAVAGYLSLWVVYKGFKWLTGREGMGYGDFKLLAVLGAWLGWQALPAVILLSSLVGAITGIAMIVLRGRDKNTPIPFGPYLAAAGWITLMWGEDMTHAYLNMAGVG